MLPHLLRNDPLEYRPPAVRVSARALVGCGVVVGWASALVACGGLLWLLQQMH